MKEEKDNTFRFRQFSIKQDKCAMKVNTDGIMLGSWVDATDSDRILDIGAGTGLIALMLAQRYVDASVLGVEIDADAFEEAHDNATASPFDLRVKMVCSSIQDFADASKEQFCHIVSNPPFFSGGTFSTNENRTNVRHTTKLSHADLIRSVNRLIRPDGRFSVVLPNLEGLRFIELVTRAGFSLELHTEVKPKASKPVERRLLTFKKGAVDEVVASELVVYEEDGTYTEGYKELTVEFYLGL